MSDERPDRYEGVGTIDDAWKTVDEATQSCHPHPAVDFTKDDIEKVFYCRWNNFQEYADTDSETIFRLKDGRYVRAEESGDSTGHG